MEDSDSSDFEDEDDDDDDEDDDDYHTVDTVDSKTMQSVKGGATAAAENEQFLDADEEIQVVQVEEDGKMEVIEMGGAWKNMIEESAAVAKNLMQPLPPPPPIDDLHPDLVLDTVEIEIDDIEPIQGNVLMSCKR